MVSTPIRRFAICGRKGLQIILLPPIKYDPVNVVSIWGYTPTKTKCKTKRKITNPKGTKSKPLTT